MEATVTATRSGSEAARATLRCLAVVPAFNERDSIAGVIADLREHCGVDVVVIDDGSGDGTAAVASGAGARVVTLPFNVGIGGAVQTGYMLARMGDYDVAIQVDGDGQHPASELERLLDALVESGADLVIGSRFLQSGAFRSTFARRAGVRLFSSLVSWLVGVRMTDTTSGFRAAGRRAIALFAEAYPHDYPEVEAVLIAHRAGLRVIEAPVEMRPRQGGRSSITPLRSGYYMVKVLLALAMQLLRRPVKLPEDVR
jgi:glycosyltransferase involved in cell wall biosynthesis